jgi:hypothetical protein
MTLQEYIITEFGIVPDDVQLEQIREIINTEVLDKIVVEHKTVIDKNWIDLQHMGFSLIKTK